MDEAMLRGDCSRCEDLCCVALAFDRSGMFAFDKPAGAPCRHLRAEGGCRKHAGLEEEGMRGCLQYDCAGAGQRVCQDVFPGRSWREGPEMARRVFDAFAAMRRVQDNLVLLHAAARLPLSAEQEAARRALIAELDPEGGWTEQALAGLAAGPAPGRIRAYLKGLRSVAGRAA